MCMYVLTYVNEPASMYLTKYILYMRTYVITPRPPYNVRFYVVYAYTARDARQFPVDYDS